MKLFKSLKICFTVVLLSSPLFSLAQYKFPIRPFFTYFRDLSRYEIGGTGTLANGTFDGTTRVTGLNNYFIGDSTLRRGIKSKFGFGATIGIDIPFAASGHISVWAVSFNAIANQYAWGDLNQTKSLDGTYTTPTDELQGTTLQIGMPIGLDWKVGCDAIESKRLRWGATLGAGALPHINITNLEPTAASDLIPNEQSIGFNPYFKVEGSYFGGMCIKLRLMYTTGNIELMHAKDRIPGYNDGPFKLTYHNNIMASLIIMPFSVRWRETRWDNTYDSYNWNEKLN